MTKYDSWPTVDTGSVVGARLANEIYNRFSGLLAPLSFDDQQRASLAELLATTDETLNVKSFGAVGNGTADDTVAIQAAIDAAETDGGTVWLPSGTYAVTSALVINSASSVELTGTGTIEMQGNAHALRLQGGAHLVQGLSFTQDGSRTDGRAVIIEGTADGSRVERCTFQTIPGSAIEIQAGAARVSILHNRIDGCGKGSAVVSPFTSSVRGADLTDCTIAFNVISDGQSKGIDIGVDTVGNDNLLIEGNHIYDHSNNIGIGVGSHFDLRIIGNYCENCGDNGIDVNDLDGLSAVGCVISGNTLVSCKDGIFYGHGATVATITGNTVRSSTRGVRLLDGAGHVTCSGNAITTTTGDGIHVNGTGGSNRRPIHLVIADNILYDLGTRGVYMNQCDHVQVRGNQIRLVDEHAVQGTDADFVEVTHNSIREWGTDTANTYDGINWSDVSASFVVSDNVFAGASRYLINMGNSVNGVVERNTWDTAGTTGDVTAIAASTLSRRNGLKGSLVFDNNGTATLANGTTSIAVTHGLDATPDLDDISVTPIEAWGSATQFWITSPTSTQFTINVNADPTQDVDFAWTASVQ